MAVRVLMVGVRGSGTGLTEGRFVGWCEGGLGQQEDDDGGSSTMRGVLWLLGS